MSNVTMAEMLAPVAARLPRVIREYEILRILADIPSQDVEASAEIARKEILAWAQRRSGSRLPPQAWNHEEFEHFSGGRNSRGVRLQTNKADVWAIRADDPDKNVAGRIWTTEVTVWTSEGGDCKFSARLLVNTDEDDFSVEPATPGYVQQLAETCGLKVASTPLTVAPSFIRSEADAQGLVALLEDPQRRLPVIVLSVPPNSTNPDLPLIDPIELARAVLGMAYVVVLPHEYTWYLTDYVGKELSVFLGAVRTYLPGFAPDANPYDHKLTLFDSLAHPEGVEACRKQLRKSVADYSVRNFQLGKDIVPFPTLRNLSIELQQNELVDSGASESEQLEAAKKRIEALKDELQQKKEFENYIIEEQASAEERARDAEKRQHASALQIQNLIGKIKELGESVDDEAGLPQTWGEFADWCDRELAGRLVLTPSARRSVKSPEYENVEEVAKCLIWLASDCRDRRIDGGGGTVREEPVLDGIRNAHCGGDTYETSWQGQTFAVDWHIKNGGNTRDPKRCLRIYYFWEPASNQIIVAEMPAHRRTGAT